MATEEVLTARIMDESGEVVAETRMNAKAFRKSLETGQIWALHPETDRLLPFGGGVTFLSLEERDGSIAITVTDTDVERVTGAQAGGSDGAQAGNPDLAGGSSERQSAEASSQRPEALSSESGERAHDGNPHDGVPSPVLSEFDQLEQTVASRRDAPPDGSYTAYLFEQGRDKIRKKVGEEAIEVLLADEKSEIVGEAADLFYHMTVLLAERGLSLSDVATELRRRREKS